MSHLPRHILIIIQAGISCKWTNDSQCYLLEHLDTICDSPSHIYHSALPFSLHSTWLQECYGSELLQEVNVVKGLPAGWGTCSRTVSLGAKVFGLSCWNNTVAVGSGHRDIIILDAITGSQIAILSGHTDEVNSVTFSSDGKSLVSGSDDRTVKLWDVQTGGAIKTFSGHTKLVRSTSISVDSTTIASGSFDETIRLWNTQTGECCCIIQAQGEVDLIKFSPTNPQLFLSGGISRISQWNISGHRAGPTFDGCYADFSPDGTQLVLRHNEFTTIQNLSTGTAVAKFQTIEDVLQHCHFSPDGRMVAVSAESIAYVWNIASTEPHLAETLIGHTNEILSFNFSSPSSLISGSVDGSVKFWKISTQSTDSVGINPKSISLAPATIMSITLQAEDNLSITSDSDGVVKTWDIFTELCKASFQTPAKGADKRDVQLINGRLVLVWYKNGKIKIWDVEKEKLLLTVDGPSRLEDIKISEDGSRIFSINKEAIWAHSIQTGEIVGKAETRVLKYDTASLTLHGSRVWIHYTNGESQVWDFGMPDSPPVQLPNTPLHIFHPNGTVMGNWSILC